MTTEEYEETLDGKKKYELMEECLRLHAALLEAAQAARNVEAYDAADICEKATEVRQ